MPMTLPLRTFVSIVLLVFCVEHSAYCGGRTATNDVNGDSVIRARAGTSEIVITTTSRLAGAIHSLTWGGHEFINSADHGRQLQTAWNADAGITPIQNETFNPTEAGSRDDGAGPVSSSKLLELHAGENVLTTRSQPAFWLKPGETSGGKPARNKTIVSNHLLSKRVQIGYRGLPHAIDYQVTVTIPADEHNTFCAIEALTGYMPPDFDKFWVYDTKTGELHPLDDGPGEQGLPIVFSTEDGAYAMGAYSPGVDASRNEVGPRYGRFKFKVEQVVKWNCVYRIKNASGLGGDYGYEVLLAVGTLEDVKSTLAGLMGVVKN
jgi:hypothetical protein